MTVKDVIKITATLLGREKVLEYLSSENPDSFDAQTLCQVDVMTRCLNIVINELACTYVPMTIRETVETKQGKVYFSDLKETLLKIRSITGENGKQLTYKLSAEYIVVDSARVDIEYDFVPCNYGITDVIGYKESQIPVRILAYGTCAEFCLTERAFDDAVVFHKKYMDGIAEICSPKNVKIRARGFI